jgi:hypothetical protein
LVRPCHQLRGDSLAAHAGFDSALVVIDSAMVNFPEDWQVHQARGMALAGLGRRDEALREVRVMRESFIYRKDLFLRPYVEIGATQILAHAGEADAAVAQLERLLGDPFPAISVHELRLTRSGTRSGSTRGSRRCSPSTGKSKASTPHRSNHSFAPEQTKRPSSRDWRVATDHATSVTS